MVRPLHDVIYMKEVNVRIICIYYFKCDVTSQNRALVAFFHVPQIKFKQFYREIKVFKEFVILLPNYTEEGLFELQKFNKKYLQNLIKF